MRRNGVSLKRAAWAAGGQECEAEEVAAAKQTPSLEAELAYWLSSLEQKGTGGDLPGDPRMEKQIENHKMK